MANEKRLIDADALIDAFCVACSTNKRYHRTNEQCRNYRDSYGNGCFKMRLVDNAPTVDAVEVVHARWIEDGYYGIPCVCSHCGNEAHYVSTFQEQFDYDWEENLVSTGYEEIKEYIRSDYCPNCGAKMDGGNEDA